jgi:N-acyl-D-aspartate/D-glutamate deacylase
MDILLKNLTLIDGTGRAPVNDASILIRDGKILYAGPASG